MNEYYAPEHQISKRTKRRDGSVVFGAAGTTATIDLNDGTVLIKSPVHPPKIGEQVWWHDWDGKIHAGKYRGRVTDTTENSPTRFLGGIASIIEYRAKGGSIYNVAIHGAVYIKATREDISARRSWRLDGSEPLKNSTKRKVA